MRRLVILCVFALTIRAQAPLPDLERVRAHMMQTLASQPNYTCLETVERSHHDRGAAKFEPIDTVRMEVALVNGKEMFGWPGSKQFEDTDIRKFIPSGMFGTGDFALHARIVFGSQMPVFEPQGVWPLDNRSVARFDFKVTRVRGGFRVRVGDVAGVVGYHGSFYADPLSLDVRKLEIIADDIPANLKMSEILDTMEYEPVTIGGGDFLLPSASEETMVDSGGQAMRNRVQFSSCRQFAGQSVISFAGADADKPAEKAPAEDTVQELQLPRNLQLILHFSSDVDLENAAVGDQIRAELVQDVKLKGRLILPKGTLASGRITRLERHNDYNFVGLTFSDLESGKLHAHVAPVFDRMTGILTPSVRNPSLNSPLRTNEAVLLLQPGRLRLAQAILMFWRT